MPYDIAPAPQNAPSRIRSRAQIKPHALSQSVVSSTNVLPLMGADYVRPSDPMLLVYQERAETFRLIAAAIRRSLKALARPYAA